VIDPKLKAATALPVDSEHVKAQLARILASQPFRNSRRCQALISYVVEQACTGRFDALKERSVGAAVFGREVDYDTNQDAVVRNAAAEVRKRLAQYYLEHATDAELRIDILPGSYVPEIHAAPTVPGITAGPASGAVRHRWVPALLTTVALGGLAAFLFATRPPETPSATDLDRFWEPVINAPAAVQVCIGQSRFQYYGESQSSQDAATIPKSKLMPMRDRFVWFGDAICMSRLSGYLSSRGKEYRHRGALTTPYAELRGYPVVLIGAFNNEWTMRLTQGLRFALIASTGSRMPRVRDTRRPDDLQWSVANSGPWADTEEDYALVTRIFDADTERWVIAAGGITHFGTMMAGDFLTNPKYFREAVRQAGVGWERKNVQVVLQTKVVGGTPGPPRVLATHFW
jgi:hypothetical protein